MDKEEEYTFRGLRHYVENLVDRHTAIMQKDRDWYRMYKDAYYDYPDEQIRIDAIKNVMDAVQFTFRKELDKAVDTVNENLDQIKAELDSVEDIITDIKN